MAVADASSVHRALADERRARILQELEPAPAGLDADELARRLGLHANTIRWHVGILEKAGLVGGEAAARTGPGRPRIVYRALRAPEPPGRDDYRLLATILTGAASARTTGPEALHEAGAAWGRYLAPRPSPLARVGEEEAVRTVSDLLDEHGFAPEVHGCDLHMRRCPFHDLAETHPDVVCTVHRGVIEGALDALGSGLRVEELDIFVRPDLCVARLGRKTS